MNVGEIVSYLAALPDQTLPVCTVNQHGDATEITSIKLAAAGHGMMPENNKQRIELE